MNYTKLLTIAGSDSGGGAGIQADLKTFSACGCYGMSAITAVTAQNSLGVVAIHPVPVQIVEAQIRAIFDDFGVDGVKIGMLHSPEVISCVAGLLKEYEAATVVLDPVMVATSGHRLIADEAVVAMKELMFPLVSLITPNIPEAEMLLGEKIGSVADMRNRAQQLSIDYKVAVLLKGGHLPGQSMTDILCHNQSMTENSFCNKRTDTKNSHGTGCTLSSAITAFLAQGAGLVSAVTEAEKYLQSAIRAGAKYTMGAGHGPVHHFYQFWS